MSARGKLVVKGCESIDGSQALAANRRTHNTYKNIDINSELVPQSFDIKEIAQGFCVICCATNSMYFISFWICCTSVCNNYKHCRHTPSRHLLCAPILDNPREHYLFGVIGNECKKIVDDTSEMSIRTSADNWCSHPVAKWGEESGERCVKQSAFKISKLHTVIVLAIT